MVSSSAGTLSLCASAAWLCLSLAACDGAADGDRRPDGGGQSGEPAAACPDGLSRGDRCNLPPDATCFLLNDFSPCDSTFCSCTGGRLTCDDAHGIGASDGESCTDSPLATCSREGVPSCDTPPTSEQCSCDADGTWHCTCACYGGGSTCGPTCPARYIPELDGALCEPPVDRCDYPGVTCRCTGDGTGQSHLVCTSTG